MAEDFIVEAADVEFFAQRFFGARAEFLDFQFTHFVCQRLTGPDDVAVDFHDDVVLGFAGVGLEIIDGLLATPAKRVQAGIHHQTDGAPHLIGQLAKLGIRVLIKPHLFAQTFRIKGPAFDEGGDAVELAKLRQAGQFFGQRQLQVVAGHGLVQGKRLHLPLGPHGEVVGVGVKKAGPSSGSGAGLVIGGGDTALNVCGHRPDAVRLARQGAEELD